MDTYSLFTEALAIFGNMPINHVINLCPASKAVYRAVKLSKARSYGWNEDLEIEHFSPVSKLHVAALWVYARSHGRLPAMPKKAYRTRAQWAQALRPSVYFAQLCHD